MPSVKKMHQTAYYRTIATIRDYPRLKEEIKRLRDESVKATAYDAMPKANSISSTVERNAVKIADMEHTIKQIDECLMLIPDDMRAGIFDNILYRTRFPLNEYGLLVPSLSKWKREKTLFIQRVAKKMDII